MTNFAPESQRFDPYGYGLASGYSDLAIPFLGPNPRPDTKPPGSQKSYAKWNMPEAYVGKANNFMKDTMEDWMFTANWTWYTERILPWKKTDDIHLRWEQWESNPHYMGITPHQSMSNVVTQRRTSMAATMVRRGIACEFEQDFVATAVGRSRWVASLVQIARSVQETANVETIRALLQCHRPQQVFIRKHGVVKDGDLDLYWQRRVDRFMIAQKSDFGLEQLSVQIDGEMEKYQGRANVWILGREVSDYCNTVPEGKIYYNLGGQEAVNRINGRPTGRLAAGGTQGNVLAIQPERLIKDTPVFLAKSFVVDAVGQADLLSRTVEVGVFNTMLCKTRDFKKYKSSDMNIRIYDNNKDDWAEITYDKAIDNCIMWDDADGGDVQDPFVGTRGRKVEDTDSNGQHDFLRFDSGPGNPKQDVKYIGDLDTTWLTTRQVLNAAQTMLNFMQTHDNVKVENLEAADTITLDADGKVSKNTNDTDKNADLRKFVQSAGNLLGADSLFFKDISGKNIVDNTTAKEIISTFSHHTNVRAERSIKPTNAPISSDMNTSSYNKTEAEQLHQNWLSSVGKIVPEDKHDVLKGIVTKSTDTWKQRAAAIEALVLDCKKSDPPSVSMNADRISGWMKTRVEKYESEFNQWINSQVSNNNNNNNINRSVEPEIIEIPIGAPLPSGYEFLNAEEERKHKSGMSSLRCPTSLADFKYISEVFQSSDNSSRQMGIQRRTLIGARGDGENTNQLSKGYQKRGYDYDQTGTLKPRDGQADYEVKTRFNNINERIKKIAESAAPMHLKYLAILYLGARFQKGRFTHLAERDVLLPCQFLLMRPHCTYRTRYGIKCADGGNTGYFFFGHSSMNIAHAASTKTGLMHYTAYMSPVVTQPKNVYVVEDLFCENYYGGMGSDFWTLKGYLEKQANRTKRSIICTMLPLNMDELESKIDVRGQWYTEVRQKLVDTERFNKMCYPGAARTAMLLQWWDPVRKGALGNQIARSRNVDINFVCFQGVQFRYNSKSETWGDATIEQGHFGPDVYPGCGKVRKGALRYLSRANYTGEAQSRHQ